MHKLEITGATPEDLFMNAVRMLSVLLKGGSTPMAPLGDSTHIPSSDNGSSPDMMEHGGSTPSEGATPGLDKVVAKAKEKKGAKGKAASKNELNDDISDVGKTIEHKALTLDGDIRPRLRAIQKAHTERGNDMPACVSYIQQLYGPFNITKADQLKVEQFAEFLEASEGYLSGEA